MVAVKDASARYKAWKELLDFSTRFALAGMKAQGMTERQAWETFRRRWMKASREHQKVNLRIARRLYLLDKPAKQGRR